MARTAPTSKLPVRKSAAQLRGGSNANYGDRPTDDGMKGDAADEPNAGSPRMPRQSPSRRKHLKR